MEYLRPDNSWKIGVSAGAAMIRFYSRAYAEYLEGPQSEEKLHAAAVAAGKRIGIRCLAAELLSTDFAGTLTLEKKYAIADDIAKLGSTIGIEHMAKKLAGKIGAAIPGLDEMLRWFVAPNVELNLYSAQADCPSVYLQFKQKKSTPKISAAEVVAGLKSAGQRKALADLSALARVRNEWNGSVGGVEIKPAALLIGPSGSGKTYCARAFASCSGWPFYEATIGGWTLQNARADSSSYTLNCIRELLDSPIILFVDEADKISTKGDRVDNWWKGVFTELMQLLDRSMGELVLTSTQRENLRNSWILLAGAFQDIYKAKRGEDMLFEEQATASITREDIENHAGLPTEFLNRCGPLIEILPPGVEDLEKAMAEIEKAAGISGTDKERRQAARRSVLNLQGFRGLEAYALEAAKKHLEKS